MATYRRGSAGPEVRRIQERLAGLRIYRGPLDGAFGGGTESAVVAFQRANGLSPDGLVGPRTWQALFVEREQGGGPALLAQSLSYRCLALTATIETGAPPPDCFAGLVGDFDGQGLSFGALQFNLGTGSLVTLLRELQLHHPGVLEEVFHRYAPVLLEVLQAEREDQLAWARSIQDDRHVVAEPWRGLWRSLGRRLECHELQVTFAARLYRAAEELCAEYGLWSERAVALMFDIKVQNGSIKPITRRQIEQDFRAITVTAPAEVELARLLSVAHRRANASLPRWAPKVLIRKRTIALGRGTIHGRWFNLEEDYGIRLLPYRAGETGEVEARSSSGGQTRESLFASKRTPDYAEACPDSVLGRARRKSGSDENIDLGNRYDRRSRKRRLPLEAVDF